MSPKMKSIHLLIKWMSEGHPFVRGDLSSDFNKTVWIASSPRAEKKFQPFPSINLNPKLQMSNSTLLAQTKCIKIMAMLMFIGWYIYNFLSTISFLCHKWIMKDSFFSFTFFAGKRLLCSATHLWGLIKTKYYSTYEDIQSTSNDWNCFAQTS